MFFRFLSPFHLYHASSLLSFVKHILHTEHHASSYEFITHTVSNTSTHLLYHIYILPDQQVLPELYTQHIDPSGSAILLSITRIRQTCLSSAVASIVSYHDCINNPAWTLHPTAIESETSSPAPTERRWWQTAKMMMVLGHAIERVRSLPLEVVFTSTDRFYRAWTLQ